MTSIHAPPSNAPLQPTAQGPNVPRGLDIGAPGHTPIPQSTDYPVHTAYENNLANTTQNKYMDANIMTSGSNVGETVLEVQSLDPKTIVVTGHGRGYTMKTTFEHHHELVTIRHGTSTEAKDASVMANVPADALPPSQAGTGTTELAEEPFIAQVEVHQLRASKISVKGGPQVKLKDWLSGRGTSHHTFEEGGKKFEWRKSFAGLSRKLELFSMDQPDLCIAWAEKPTLADTTKHHVPGVPPLGNQGIATDKQHIPEAQHLHANQGTATNDSHVPGLPAKQGNAKLTITSQAMPIIDMVVASFLLVERESQENPLH